MKKNMRKSIFSIDGSSNEDTWIEGYFNPEDGKWNGWTKVILDIETLKNFINFNGFDYRIIRVGKNGKTAFVIDWRDIQSDHEILDIIEFQTVDGDIMEGCYMDGWCYVEVGENYNG